MRIKMSKYMTFGCSHTDGMSLAPKYHWPNILKRKIGVEFLKYAQCGAGLLHIVSYISNEYDIKKAEQVEYVVLQKPESFRFPWWKGYDISKHSKGINKMFNKRGWRWLPKRDIRWQSKNYYPMLKDKESKEVADKLFEADVKMLNTFVSFFQNAKLAYYHYWIDDLLTKKLRPNLAENNIKLGEVAESLGMSNWGMLLNPRTVDGAYKNNNIILDKKILFKNGYIVNHMDRHPGPKHQKIVSKKVIEWLQKEGDL